MKNEVLRVFHMAKSIGERRVFEDVSFYVEEGEWVGIVGLEKVGKLVLFNILRGTESYDRGTIFAQGKVIGAHSPRKAREAGVFSLTSNPKVLGNMTIGMYLYIFNKNNLGRRWVFSRTVYAEAEAILERFEWDINPRKKLKSLSGADMMVLELILIFIQKPKLIVLENVSMYEIVSQDGRAWEIIRKMQAGGTAFLSLEATISQTLLTMCSRAYILKDGYLSTEIKLAGTKKEQLYSLLTGGAPVGKRQLGTTEKGGALLSIFRGNSPFFALNSGEIAGVILGNIPIEDLSFVLDFLYGEDKRGRVLKQGKTIVPPGLLTLQKNGIAVIPDPYSTEGIFMNLSLNENLVERRPHVPYKGPKRLSVRERDYIAGEMIRTLGLNIQGGDKKLVYDNLRIEDLEKIWIGRWLWRNPEVFIFVNPFSIVDEKGYEELRKTFRFLADMGKGVLIMATNYKKMYEVCDRVMDFSV